MEETIDKTVILYGVYGNSLRKDLYSYKDELCLSKEIMSTLESNFKYIKKI